MYAISHTSCGVVELLGQNVTYLCDAFRISNSVIPTGLEVPSEGLLYL